MSLQNYITTIRNGHMISMKRRMKGGPFVSGVARVLGARGQNVPPPPPPPPPRPKTIHPLRLGLAKSEYWGGGGGGGGVPLEFGQIQLLPFAFGNGYVDTRGGSLCVWPSRGRIQDLGAGESDGVAGHATQQAGSGAEPQPLCNFRTFKVTKHSIIAKKHAKTR